MSYLLDTDTCSAFLKGNRQVWHKYMLHAGQLSISAITSAELFAWVLRATASSARKQGMLDLLDHVTFLDVDRHVAEKFGEIRAGQLDAGQFTPVMDLLLASTALVYGLTLVTHNVQDYVHVPGLIIDDWIA